MIRLTKSVSFLYNNINTREKGYNMNQAMACLIAERIHHTVSTGTLGNEFTFAHERDKNMSLRRRYRVNDQKMIEILLELKSEHYIKSENSDNKKHPNDVVHVFKILKDLLPRYDENADYVQVCIYIKVTWPDGNDPMFIISFHEDE